ncbi:MAG: L-threonylcarbamoyladenylate synthase [Cytophagaceae bacterium]
MVFGIGSNIEEAALFLRQGKLVAIPTETVYGLAGNGLNPDAVLEIFKVKSRPFFDPLILHISSTDQLKSLVLSIPEPALKLAEVFWPGPLTMVFPKKEIVPDLVSSGLNTVAIRIPDHPLTRQLLQLLDFPLAAPSANPFGYISPTTAQHVADQLGEKIPYILDGGPCKIGVESTIVGFENGKVIIYRAGGTSIESIEEIVGKTEIITSQEKPSVPGMLESHYAPRTKLMAGEIKELRNKYGTEKTGYITFRNYIPGIDKNKQMVLSPDGSLDLAARNLFSSMRLMDASGYDLILAELVPDEGLGRAINDRLRRASK